MPWPAMENWRRRRCGTVAGDHQGDRAAIEAALAAKVPPLTDAELAGLERGRAALAPMLEELAARGLRR